MTRLGMIKAIIFDAGGVLVKHKDEDRYDVLIKKLGIAKTKFNEVKKKYYCDAQKGIISTNDLMEKIARDLNLDKEKLSKAWHKAHTECLLFDKEAFALAASLKKNGYMTALISNAIKLRGYGSEKRDKQIQSGFDHVIISYKVGTRKPEKKIYELMLEKLKLKPFECIFLDDREENVVVANELGMTGIVVKSVQQLKEDLQKLGVKL